MTISRGVAGEGATFRDPSRFSPCRQQDGHVVEIESKDTRSLGRGRLVGSFDFRVAA
jgi:hypothetical protein